MAKSSNSLKHVGRQICRASCLGTVLLGLFACAGQGSLKPPADLTPDHYASRSETKSKPDIKQTTINTEKGFEEPYSDPQHYRGLYLLASIDHKTGKTAFALDFMQMTDKPRTKVLVYYDAPEGLMKQNIYVRNARTVCREPPCRTLESVSIPLKESLLRHFAQRYTPNLDTHWHFRIEPDFDGEVSYAEMAGLLKRVDEARKTSAPRPIAE